jgi:hypothetical protein
VEGKRRVTQEEIDKLMYQLSKVRDPNNPPTKEEVIKMIIRMKERWGIA